MPTDRALRRRLVRSLAMLLLSILLGALITAPVAAQEEDSTAEDAPLTGFDLTPEGETDPPPDPEPAPDSSSQPEPEGASEPAPAPETVAQDEVAPPIVRQIVDDGDRSIQIIESDDSRYPTIDVVIAVPPALAGDLATSSFAMTENGDIKPLRVAKLRDILEVVVVIDTSGSMDGEPLESAKIAAKDFVDQLDADTRLAVVGFGATASTKASFDSSRSEIAAAIDGLQAEGETALYDGLSLAADLFEDTNARRFVVVLSDGTDTASSAGLDAAAEALIDQDANLYAITLSSADADFSGLRELTTTVDGELVNATDTASLSDTYAAVASRLTNQYQVTYDSSAAGESRIVISVDSEGILAVAKQTLDFSAVSGSAPQATETDTDSGGAGPAGEVTRSTVDIDTSDPLVYTLPDSSSPLTSENARYIGLGALFLGVVVGLFVTFSAEPKGPSAFERLNLKSTAASPRSGMATIADRATALADRILERQQKRGALDAALERAGMEMRPGEYIMASAAAAVALGIFGFVMIRPIAGLVGLGVGVLGGKLFVGFKAGRRQKAFANQLGDTLMMIAGSIRAGHGVVEAIDTVASQAEAPTGEEFSRAVAEARIGRDMIESLYDIADRTNSEDFIWVVRAISINRELGGDLAEILDNVGETIRDRNRLRDQVKALSAEGKVSAIILFGLPILVAIWVRISNPEYMNAMTGETAGKFVFGFAVFCLIAGGVWLKKLVKVDF